MALKLEAFKALSNNRFYMQAKRNAIQIAARSLQQKAFIGLRDYNMRRKYYLSKEHEF